MARARDVLPKAVLTAEWAAGQAMWLSQARLRPKVLRHRRALATGETLDDWREQVHQLL
jgi:hypothetical protein